MKYVLPIIIFGLFTVRVTATTNENIIFLQQIHKEAKAYSAAELKKWSLGEGEAIVPESADHRNLSHMKLLVAANPDRYEGYVMYGFHFFLKGEFDVAVASYDQATKIVKKNDIKDALNYSKYYCLSLIKLYRQKREHNPREALTYIDKIMSFDSEYFSREPQLTVLFPMIVSDYVNSGKMEDARLLVQNTKGIPPEIRLKLEQQLK